MPRSLRIKKLLTFLLAAALLTGCAGKSRRPEPPPAPEPAQQIPRDPETAAREDPETLEPTEAAPEQPEPQEPPEASADPEQPREPLPRICIDPGHYAGVNQFTDGDGVT